MGTGLVAFFVSRVVLKKTEVKMHRGVRRKDLFEDEMDYQVFLGILKSGLKNMSVFYMHTV